MELIVLIIAGYFAYRYYNKNKYRNRNTYQNNTFIGKYIDIDNSDIKDEVKSSETEANGYIDTAKSPFLMAHSLLTNAELNFYKILREVISDNQIICPKVRMQDILWTKTYKVKDKQVFINKVNRKHLDFVICDKESLKPLLAIELDDKSHEEPQRKERDSFVNALFNDLGFKIIHITVQYSYNLDELKSKIQI